MSKKPEKKKKKKKSWISTLILVLIFLIGLSVMLYPTVSDWWNSFHQTRAIEHYVEAVAAMSEEDIQAYFDAADEYNAHLAETGTHFVLSDEEQEWYDSLLDPDGNGLIGYITISNINVYLPIYHGTSAGVLAVGVGNLEGTSLPVGGETTHTVLSAHRGLPSARLFTDLDEMQEGDTFSITVLDRTITYQVDQIRIVLPEETSDLAISFGEDYATLVTCTPYGVNTHRLLVRGHRIESNMDDVYVASEGTKLPTYIVFPAIMIPLLFIALAGMLIYYRKRRRSLNEDEIARMVSVPDDWDTDTTDN